MPVPYYGNELKADLLPRWHRIKDGSLKFTRGMVRFKLATELVDAGAWRYPPHVALANLSPGEQTLRGFLTRYGPLGLGTGIGDVSMLTPREVLEPDDTSFSLEVFYSIQRRLRRAWEAGDPQLFADPPVGDHYWPLDVKVRRGRLVIEVRSLLDYVNLLLAQDLATGHAKVCQNETACAAPYFIAKRADAMYCSHPCAVLMNVRRFRARIHRRKR